MILPPAWTAFACNDGEHLIALMRHQSAICPADASVRVSASSSPEQRPPGRLPQNQAGANQPSLLSENGAKKQTPPERGL